ncbi:unnamed protein product [Euphydryas editha]|uniref:Uncharacterized protein n=1 Tax=Euphydryas editha TaxID=104508 RepID=A0AAU9UXP8_EUPED|nr:unnamed protein product [Euphydryas editha]
MKTRIIFNVSEPDGVMAGPVLEAGLVPASWPGGGAHSGTTVVVALRVCGVEATAGYEQAGLGALFFRRFLALTLVGCPLAIGSLAGGARVVGRVVTIPSVPSSLIGSEG